MNRPDIPTGVELRLQTPKQSPSWELYQNWPSGMMIQDGFPFSEGFPSGGPFGNQDIVYEIITRDGVRYDAQVDYTAQYKEEGLQWRIKSGLIGKQVVVAWRQKE